MFENKKWFNKLNSTQKKLLKQSFYLLKLVQKDNLKLFDYSFLVVPAAKAYEGYLKKWLFDLDLISRHDFEEEFFRIGKALNPELENIARLKKECLYNEISEKCGERTAQFLWRTWKRCRNRLVHYFEKEKQNFNLQQAKERLKQIVAAIELSSQFSKRDNENKKKD